MFTAVLVTRSFLVLLAMWKPFRNPKLLGLHVPKSKVVSADEGGRS